MQRGLLDPEKEDPFSLFVASTNIRYCFYHDTHKILGNTFGMCVLQVSPYSRAGCLGVIFAKPGQLPHVVHSLYSRHTPAHVDIRSSIKPCKTKNMQF